MDHHDRLMRPDGQDHFIALLQRTLRPRRVHPAPVRPRPRPCRWYSLQLRREPPRSAPAPAALAAMLTRQHGLGRVLATCTHINSSAARFHRRLVDTALSGCRWSPPSGSLKDTRAHSQLQRRNASRPADHDQQLRARSIDWLQASATAPKEAAKKRLLVARGADAARTHHLQAAKIGL